MQRAFSAGGIIFKEDKDGLQFLLARNQSMTRPEVDYWGFPKGHLEEGESSETAALREVKEETGVKAEIIKKVGSSEYIYTSKNEGPVLPDEAGASRGGGKIFKIVTLFLMKYLSGEAKPQDGEISEVEWLSAEAVQSRLSFAQDSILFKKALELKGVSS
ncbi:MAG: NUDIX domain-containing protein [Candidatus Daviesbacteria bacterium]|nr:NUDIX domain-containing protein [Candidatus Daviesbacteria bacterium]